MSAPTLTEMAEEHIRCDYCGSEPGVPCVVAKGRTAGTTARYMHDGRWQSAHLIWSVGYEEGVEEGRWRQENGR